MQGAIDYISATGQIKALSLGKGRQAFEHAVIEWLSHRLTWSLSASAGAVEVNGRSLAPGASVLLSHMDEILVGQVRGRFLRIPDAPTLRGKPTQQVLLGRRRLHIGRQEGKGGRRISQDASAGCSIRRMTAAQPRSM